MRRGVLGHTPERYERSYRENESLTPRFRALLGIGREPVRLADGARAQRVSDLTRPSRALRVERSNLMHAAAPASVLHDDTPRALGAPGREVDTNEKTVGLTAATRWAG